MLTVASDEYIRPQQTDVSTVFSLAELGSIVLPLVEERGMGDARVFGSYARGEATGYSDIDLIVDRKGESLLSVGGLAEDILLATGKLADVYDISELVDGPFKETVLREAVELR